MTIRRIAVPLHFRCFARDNLLHCHREGRRPEAIQGSGMSRPYQLSLRIILGPHWSGLSSIMTTSMCHAEKPPRMMKKTHLKRMKQEWICWIRKVVTLLRLHQPFSVVSVLPAFRNFSPATAFLVLSSFVHTRRAGVSMFNDRLLNFSTASFGRCSPMY